MMMRFSVLLLLLHVACHAVASGLPSGSSQLEGNGTVWYLLPNGSAATDAVRILQRLVHGVLDVALPTLRRFSMCTGTSMTRAAWVHTADMQHKRPWCAYCSFDYKLYNHFLTLGEGAQREGDAYSSYAYQPRGSEAFGYVESCGLASLVFCSRRPHCDKACVQGGWRVILEFCLFFCICPGQATWRCAGPWRGGGLSGALCPPLLWIFVRIWR